MSSKQRSTASPHLLRLAVAKTHGTCKEGRKEGRREGRHTGTLVHVVNNSTASTDCCTYVRTCCTVALGNHFEGVRTPTRMTMSLSEQFWAVFACANACAFVQPFVPTSYCMPAVSSPPRVLSASVHLFTEVVWGFRPMSMARCLAS